MFRSAEESHVFEGYLVLYQDALFVKAFAGPGVDLFTIIRKGAEHREVLHIPAIAKKMDMAAIGADIARVYLGGCPPPNRPDEVSCHLLDDKMIERYGPDELLEARDFPNAHDIGVHIAYEDYSEMNGTQMATRITLTWGNSQNRMVIKLLSYEILDEIDPTLFDVEALR